MKTGSVQMGFRSLGVRGIAAFNCGLPTNPVTMNRAVPLDLHEILFLLTQQFVDLFDVLVGQALDNLLAASLFIL